MLTAVACSESNDADSGVFFDQASGTGGANSWQSGGTGGIDLSTGGTSGQVSVVDSGSITGGTSGTNPSPDASTGIPDGGLEVMDGQDGVNDGGGKGGTDADSGSSGIGGDSGSGGTGADSGSGGTGGQSHTKFVGNITTNGQVDPTGLKFATYWDQITPENAGKWGSVQSTPDSNFNWSTLDAIYDYAEDNGILFKQHTFVWGSQQPNGVPTEQQVISWIRTFCERYPNTALIDVVNEPLPHTTPNYADNIGGGTNNNWQRITNSFKWARQYCPGAILILNDYNNIEWPNDNQHSVDIVNTELANGGPIDAIGAQAHDLDHCSVSLQPVTQLFNKLHNDTDLPVYITEMDLSYTDDQAQLNAYRQYFP